MYSSKEKDTVEKITGFIFLKSYINLSKPEVLKNYLISEKYLENANSILEKIYEVGLRTIATNNYGAAFTAEIEILAYLMKISKNKTVLEIAGASGENALMLTLSGAKKVYMNDIDSTENLKFKINTQMHLPKEIQNKIQGLPGDIFKLIKTIKSKVDIILCRNFIHFLNDDKLSDIFSLLRKKLIKGGKAVFITNSIYSSSGVFEVAQKNPKRSSFKLVQLLVTDRQKSGMPCMIPLIICTTCCSKLIGTDYTALYLYERVKGEQWKDNKKAFNKLDKSIRKKVIEAINKSAAAIKKIKKGSIRVLISYVRCYSKKSLAYLFEKNGFLTEYTFVVKKNGHLLKDNELPKKPGQQVGIIATLK